MLLILNDVAGSEILLILVFVLIFFGAKSIPGLARTLGRTIRQVKDASAEIQNEIRKSGNDMKKDLNLKSLLDDTVEDIKRPLDQYAQDIDNAVKYQAPRNKNSKIPPAIDQSTAKIEKSDNVADEDEIKETTKSDKVEDSEDKKTT